MIDNMRIWNAVKQPPQSALKTIMGGRLKGKTDINPQWRYKAMTEQFGVCGIGWKYDITRIWNELVADGQVFAFAEINLYIMTKDGDEDVWSDAVPGVGGSMLVEKEASGLHASDEGYKMAITDALSVAMKMLGVGADIYEGRWDGTKYRDSEPNNQSSASSSAPEAATDKSHWCQEHNTIFFMRGKMTSYGHPLKDNQGKDTGEWCHEHKEEPKKATEHPPNATGEVLHPAETQVSIIDLDWLKEQQKELLAKGLESWDNKGLRDRIDKITGKKTTKVSEAILNLSKEQAEAFVKTIQNTLIMRRLAQR